jgi:osmoprotectant transport system ATP-binding protein
MIRLVDATRRYGEHVVVDRVSLHVAEGESLVLIGGSGSGKTTTCKLVNRLVEPSAGQVLVAGQDVASVPAHELRRRIGYVFQRLGLFPHMTVAQNIGITPRLLGWDEARVRARVRSLLELVELDPDVLADRRPDALSGGQAQRVAVARALAAEPPVLLMDEPFGALDPLTRERLQQAFDRIRRALRLTVVFVTHDMSEAMRLGDRIAVMKDGRLLQIGTARQLHEAPADPAVRELFAAPRRQAELVAAVLERGSP